MKNKDDWSSYWNQLNTLQDIPDIDFARNMVISFYVGEKTTDGYSVKINQIEQKDNIINVNYTYTEPGSNSITFSKLTYPVYIVKLEKSNLNVKFIGTKKQIN
ncbi:protease complex subunit PrcB family protein [Candidatus Poribacteria bacterium]|nr:protease complex subunit PrcB family protein [Candidatus Poribacteria bacterium]